MKESRFPGTAGVLAGMREAHSPENTGGVVGDAWKNGGHVGVARPRSRKFCALRAHAGEDAGGPKVSSHAPSQE